MDTQHIKEEVDKNLEKLTTLRDEVKVQLHLATLDAKQEWDEKLAPKVLEVEQTAKSATESTRQAVKELVGRLEDFLARLRGGPRSSS
jgi:alcohol dehydrogenase class IV